MKTVSPLLPVFSRKDYFFFVSGLTFIIAGYCCMAFDTADNGFGIPTLWIAPPLLLAGFFLPVIGIVGVNHLATIAPIRRIKSNWKKHVAAWAAFAISFLVYIITVEPTASLWDCSEFIASAYKLQVPHTPGTPLSLLIGRLFTVISFGDVSRVAWSLNVMSAFFSASSIFLLYHIIHYLGEKCLHLQGKQSSLPLSLASFSGSLTFAFTDTFWFSAVEAEAYGPACFFLLLIVWLILIGKDQEAPLRGRFLVLIFYISGLAYCIHPMCLLALPLLPLLWFARTMSMRSVIVLSSAGLVLVFLINRLIAIGVFELAFSFDLFFVNNFNLPFYSGAFILLIVAASLIVFLLKKTAAATPYVWCVVFLIMGFSPYALLFIRSNHNPPIDETNPENLAMIKAYMNRESYGSSPLLYGPYFDAQIEAVKIRKTVYHKSTSGYAMSGTIPEYVYDASRKTILPRLYSNDEDHIESYRRWTGLRKNDKPHFSDNLEFLFHYQLGHMYFRYFLWNFAGREGDVQNSGWLKPWNPRGTPANITQNIPARNQYWMLPLLVGITGMIFQYKRDRKGFAAVAILFLVTGVILALYLNSTPNEPRERDYIYVGSYLAFSIWMGLGFFALLNFTRRKNGFLIPGIVASIALPAWMLYENYNDHNRSGRTFQVDHARNVLSSCAPNSILFTGGDNDTFPLWYLQEVEGYRTDIRVVVLSYFNTDWYVNQLRKRYYDSDSFSLTLDQKDYRQYGANDVLYIQESIKEGIDVRKYIQLLKEEHKALTMYSGTGDAYHILPSRTLKLKASGYRVSNGFTSLSQQGADSTEAEMTIRVSGNYLQKNALAVLDLMVSNNWQRPIYFNFTSLNTVGLDLNAYVVQEGNVYRLHPVKNNENDITADTGLMYSNLIEKADYSNLADSSIYFNYEDYQARMIAPLRQSFNTLAAACLLKGDVEMAEKVLLFAVEKLYPGHLQPSYTNLQAAEMFRSLGRTDVAKSLCSTLFDFHYEQLRTELNERHTIDRLDAYLAEQSAALLNELGDNTNMRKFEGLGLQ